MIRVEVSYPWDELKSVEENFALGEVLEKIAEKYNGGSWAAGTGLGQRDISFEFKTEEEAKKFQDEAGSLRRPELYVSGVFNDGEDD